MSETEKLRCQCGAEMNLHSEKLDYAATASDPEAANPDLGGVVSETHACPECGESASRISAAE